MTASVPVASVTVASVPVASVTVASVPVASVPVASVPVASVPVASVPVASVPVASVPVASVTVASVTVAEILAPKVKGFIYYRADNRDLVHAPFVITFDYFSRRRDLNFHNLGVITEAVVVINVDCIGAAMKTTRTD